MAVIAANCPEVSKPLCWSGFPAQCVVDRMATHCLSKWPPRRIHASDTRPLLELTTITFAYETPSAEERLLGSNFASWAF